MEDAEAKAEPPKEEPKADAKPAEEPPKAEAPKEAEKPADPAGASMSASEAYLCVVTESVDCRHVFVLYFAKKYFECMRAKCSQKK